MARTRKRPDDARGALRPRFAVIAASLLGSGLSVAHGAYAAEQSKPWSVTAQYTADLIDDVAGGVRLGGGHLQKFALSGAYDGAKDGHDGWAGLLSAQYIDGGSFVAAAWGISRPPATSTRSAGRASMRPGFRTSCPPSAVS